MVEGGPAPPRPGAAGGQQGGGRARAAGWVLRRCCPPRSWPPCSTAITSLLPQQALVADGGVEVLLQRVVAPSVDLVLNMV